MSTCFTSHIVWMAEPESDFEVGMAFSAACQSLSRLRNRLLRISTSIYSNAAQPLLL